MMNLNIKMVLNTDVHSKCISHASYESRIYFYVAICILNGIFQSFTYCYNILKKGWNDFNHETA